MVPVLYKPLPFHRTNTVVPVPSVDIPKGWCNLCLLCIITESSSTDGKKVPRRSFSRPPLEIFNQIQFVEQNTNNIYQSDLNILVYWSVSWPRSVEQHGSEFWPDIQSVFNLLQLSVTWKEMMEPENAQTIICYRKCLFLFSFPF